MVKWVLAVVLSAVVGCSGEAPAASVHSALSCPPGQVQAHVDGGAHCYIPGGDWVNAQPGCHPVACEAYDDWGTNGDGGAGAKACAAACMSYCDGDPANERLNLLDAADAGASCVY